MKKFFSFFTLCIVLCVVSCYDDTALRERLEALETTTIASINEQISGIKKSITDLEAIDKELDAAIKALINEDGALDERIKSLNDSITELRKADAATQAEIDDMAIELQNLVAKDMALDEEISALEKSIAELKATDASMTDEINAMQETLIVLKSQDDAINKQIAEIEKAIEELRSEDSALQSEIASINERLKKLEERDATFLADIDSLKAKDEALDARISELKSYVETELSSNKDWVSATFSTLEQYEALCKEIAAIKLLISEQEESLMEALIEAIAKSETTMKTWVNEQLTGYWTIAQTQAKLDTIKSTTDKEITSIRKEIQTVKDELTTAYKTEIQKAIEESNGNLSAQIAEINSNLSTRITAIEARLTVIEEKLNNLTREFAINFNDNEIGIMPGGTTTVRYTITGATPGTIVKVLAQNGWVAKVTPTSNNEGTITVTAPNPMTNDEIIVLVYDGEYQTIMSSLNFVKGFATPSQTAIEFGAEASTVNVTLTSNIDYEISIPIEAQHWLSVVQSTRAVTSKTVKFSCKTFIGGIRKATVTIADKYGNVASIITFVQQGSSTEVDLTEAGTLADVIGMDKYKDVRGLTINGPINGTDIISIRRMTKLVYLNLANARIVTGGAAYYTSTYDKYYTKDNVIGDYMFNGLFGNISAEVILPSNIERIGQGAFDGCRGLKTIILPNTLRIIEDYAFNSCRGLTSVVFPENLESIGGSAFYDCREMKFVSLPSNIKNIGDWAFWGNNLDYVELPEQIQTIGAKAFNNNNITKITIPNSLISIKQSAFLENPIVEVNVKGLISNVGSNLFDTNVYRTAALNIPKGTTDYYFSTDFGMFNTINEVFEHNEQ